MTAPAADPARSPAETGRRARLPELSYFFPAHNEEDNLEPLVEEALATLPALADRFEIVIVDDGSRDQTRRDRRSPGRRLTQAPSGRSTTRSTSATGRPFGRASGRLASGSSHSPTVIASSGSPIWGG